MGFFSGLTANGLLGTIAGVGQYPRFPAAAGKGPPAPGRAGRRNLLDRLGEAFDPQRLAMIQATLAGDYEAVARMTEPLRRQRLARRAAMEQAGREDRSTAGGMGSIPAPMPAEHEANANGAFGYGFDPPIAEQPGTKALPKARLATAIQDDPMTRQMATAPEPQGDPSFGAAIVQNSRRAAEEAERIRRATIMKGVNGYGYLPPKSDHNLLARALFAEGANTPEDMEALAFTIGNRIRPRNSRRRGRELGTTLEEVLSAPGQFSFWPNADQPEGSPNWVLSAHPERMNAQERASWNTALKMAERMLTGQYRDPTDHASFFFASRDYDGNPDNWRDAPDDFYRHSIRDGSLIPSPYRSPYSPGRYPWANYFFETVQDRGPPKR